MPKTITPHRPLTSEEQEFARVRHNLIYTFLNSKKLSIYEYYDIVAIGFLYAVTLYHDREDLKKYAFSSIAWRRMDSAFSSSLQKRSATKRKGNSIAVSLEMCLGDSEEFTVMNVLPADGNIYDRVEFDEFTQAVLKPLTESEKQILSMKFLGYDAKDIRRVCEINRGRLYRSSASIREKCAGLKAQCVQAK